MTEWQPIETYPALSKNPPVAIGCMKNGGGVFVFVWRDGKAYISPGIPMYFGFPDRQLGYMTCTPDYWMPLPAPPKKGDEQ
jgi:hypothetical protein